ncbi:fucolectin-like [Stegostoma tigrinum]|uniref:fucolectin-like n=1 Tax=Stegostoma tigrinum TaxID=3053191 RepID=UPI00286FEBA6|nr:fucolectin-like [Stegostoma tigrinum]
MLPCYLWVLACLWGCANSHPATGNLAGTIRATQSSLADFLGDASNAIDGNNMTDISKGSCSRTKVELSPWWRVDFHYHYRVYQVSITTSSDKALEGAEIHIGDHLENNGISNELCVKIESIPAGQTQMFNCKPLGVHGVFLTISVPGKETCLRLCEVQAFGTYEPHSIVDHEH